MYKLYHYLHCPFCIRVRMALGALKTPYKSIILPYHDEEIPLSLCGVKMVPILGEPDGSHMNESLDIIRKIDPKNQLHSQDPEQFSRFHQLIDPFISLVHNLSMPHWIYTPEFDSKSREYFRTKKEQKRGPFVELVKKNKLFVKELCPHLETLSSCPTPYFNGANLELLDILVASALWGLYIVPEFQFPPSLHDYLQRVGATCNFTYYPEDFWQSSL